MSDDNVGCIVLILAACILFGVGAVVGEFTGREQGRCTERWRYQHTQYDTLQTVRSGCDLPQVRR